MQIAYNLKESTRRRHYRNHTIPKPVSCFCRWLHRLEAIDSYNKAVVSRQLRSLAFPSHTNLTDEVAPSLPDLPPAGLKTFLEKGEELDAVRVTNIGYNAHPDGGHVDTRFLVIVGYMRRITGILGILVVVEDQLEPYYQNLLVTPTTFDQLFDSQLINGGHKYPDELESIITQFVTEINQEEIAQTRPQVLE